jgi:hypothetical protein
MTAQMEAVKLFYEWFEPGIWEKIKLTLRIK